MSLKGKNEKQVRKLLEKYEEDKAEKENEDTRYLWLRVNSHLHQDILDNLPDKIKREIEELNPDD